MSRADKIEEMAEHWVSRGVNSETAMREARTFYALVDAEREKERDSGRRGLKLVLRDMLLGGLIFWLVFMFVAWVQS